VARETGCRKPKSRKKIVGKEEDYMKEINSQLRAAVLEVVENQLGDLNPPETKQTFDRLRKEGHSDDEAKRLLGCVVASEIFEVLKRGQPFDPIRYAQALARLPKMPWDE
jgi:hypothetical protein